MRKLSVEEYDALYWGARELGYSDQDWKAMGDYFQEHYLDEVVDGGGDMNDALMNAGEAYALDMRIAASYEEDYYEDDDDDEGGLYAGLGAAAWEDDGCGEDLHDVYDDEW